MAMDNSKTGHDDFGMIPQFSDYLFWDVNRSKIDFQKHKALFIRRAFEIGTLDDLTEAIVFYGRDSVRDTLLSANSLQTNAVDLAKVLFHVKATDFKCYTSKPFPMG